MVAFVRAGAVRVGLRGYTFRAVVPFGLGV